MIPGFFHSVPEDYASIGKKVKERGFAVRVVNFGRVQTKQGAEIWITVERHGEQEVLFLDLESVRFLHEQIATIFAKFPQDWDQPQPPGLMS